MLSLIPHQLLSDDLPAEFSSKARAIDICPQLWAPSVKAVSQPSNQDIHFVMGHRDARFILPNLLTQSMSDHEIQALVNAHWNKFLIEEIILAQTDDLEREADEIGQLQLAYHKLERARLEVTYYTGAIDKAAKARMGIVSPVAGGSRDGANHKDKDPLSGSPTETPK